MSVVRVSPNDTVELLLPGHTQALSVGPVNVLVGNTAGIPCATTFRLPMRDLDTAWYEATRRYGPYNVHPNRCEDWNLESGGNSDLGEPLVAPFCGMVTAAANYGGGIGRVVQILGITLEQEVIIWAGWHLHEIAVIAGQMVQMGDAIGSIGNADGRYAGAHLHEQICVLNAAGIPAPITFASDSRYDWRQPSQFYIGHGVDAELVNRVANYDGV